MFARVFDTAKRILSRSPSYQGRSSEVRDTSADPADLNDTMVTTRGGIETPGSVATPVSSTRRRNAKRELDSSETPTQTKRQRKAAPPPRKKVVQETPQPDDPAPESTEDSSDTLPVAAPESATSTKEDLLPLRQRSSPRVIVAKPSPPASPKQKEADAPVEEAEYHTPEQQASSVYATPATQKQFVDSPTPKAKQLKSSTPSTVKRGRGRPKKNPQEDEPSTLEVTQITTKVLGDDTPALDTEKEGISSASQDSSVQAQKAHMRFGSEEPDTMQESITVNGQGHTRYEAPPADGNEEEDDGSDSDEAPEVVTTAAATSAAAAARADTERARLAQQAKEAAKRAAREELLAAQAAAKREREEKKARKLAKQLAREQKAAHVSASAEEEDQDAKPEDSKIRAPFTFENGLLPTSFLADLPDTRPPTPPPSSSRRGKTQEELRKEKLNHHIKFLERTEKGVKDVKKGRLNVSVLGQANRVLPPKANRDTRNVREVWLQGRGVEKKKKRKEGGKSGKGKVGRGMERKGLIGGNRGFLRGGDDE